MGIVPPSPPPPPNETTTRGRRPPRPSAVEPCEYFGDDDLFVGLWPLLGHLWRFWNHDRVLTTIERLLSWACKVRP